MKKMDKTGLKGLLFTALIMAPGLITCQEFIKRPKLGIDTSIVREISVDDWLTCSYNNLHSTFTLVNESNTMAPALSLPSYYFVSDFEIYNDTAYFCGYVDSTQPIAFFGYFEVSTFPTTTVYCSRVRLVDKFNKIEVFNNNNTPHLVFTGIIGKHQNILADALLLAPNSWDIYISYIMDIPDLKYDDIAVTDDYIVVTSRLFNLDSGLIHFFNKPPIYSTIFPFYHFSRSVQYDVVSPILITACNNNSFATLCQNTPSSFVTSQYNFIYDIYSLESTMYEGKCLDINFNAYYNSVESVIFDKSIKYGATLAIHYDNALPTTTSLTAHRFDFQHIQSIDYLDHNHPCFIASGYHIDEQVLRLYRYLYNNWHTCMEETEISTKRIDNKRKLDYNKFTPMQTYEDATVIECDS